ncbi:MAG: homoprotocatechuate degradation operon regulator HpaR [Nitratireductor sp.]|nr:homoprotocatechuate degradation operon regulator HpaR [Nitratireductor sp.]MCB1454826.1 homoprotocatechuate degradation operon regulator HpaR [Nitratireductor sp.]
MPDSFSPTRRTLPIALLRAREAVMEHFRPMLQKHGVTEQQWRVLRVIREAGETDASDLARNACILAPSLSRIIKTLDANGFIESRKDPADGRRAMISLTQKAEAFINEVAPESAAIYAELEKRAGKKQIAELLSSIDALIAAIESQA